MDRIFSEKDAELHRQLCSLYTLRPKLESKQQNLLIKSVFLTRFIRIASLDKLRNQPEITIARKLLSGIMPDLKPLEGSGSMMHLIEKTKLALGNRSN